MPPIASGSADTQSQQNPIGTNAPQTSGGIGIGSQQSINSSAGNTKTQPHAKRPKRPLKETVKETLAVDKQVSRLSKATKSKISSGFSGMNTYVKENLTDDTTSDIMGGQRDILFTIIEAPYQVASQVILILLLGLCNIEKPTLIYTILSVAIGASLIVFRHITFGITFVFSGILTIVIVKYLMHRSILYKASSQSANSEVSVKQTACQAQNEQTVNQTQSAQQDFSDDDNDDFYL
jgi:hypothetical protein